MRTKRPFKQARKKVSSTAGTNKASNYPVLCEPDLEEVINTLAPAERRALAETLELYAIQARFSADIIEKLAQPQPPIDPVYAVPLLELAARLEKQALDIRHSQKVLQSWAPPRLDFLAVN